jgi:DNA-directed RNA polymerase subunit M/transcription elongation factor TFIIS
VPALSPQAEQLLAQVRARAAARAQHPSRLPARPTPPATTERPCELCGADEAARWLLAQRQGTEPVAACARCISRQRHRSTYTTEPFVTYPLEG